MKFRDEYDFLSNMYTCEIQDPRFSDLIYDNVEAAFQASKTLDYDYRKTFTNMMNIMLDASDKIILMANEKSKLIKHNLPAYLDNLPIHIQNWKNKTLVKNIYDVIGKKLK